MIRLLSEEEFLSDVASHSMRVLHDDGTIRHLRFSRPDTRAMSFDILTWPGICATRATWAPTCSSGSAIRVQGRINEGSSHIPGCDRPLAGPCECEAMTPEERAIRAEIIATWRAMQGVGQTEAYRILERMVDRLGYGRTDGNPSLAQMEGEG